MQSIGKERVIGSAGGSEVGRLGPQGTPGKQTLTASLMGAATGPAHQSADDVAAQDGIAGAGGPLPHLDLVQRLSGAGRGGDAKLDGVAGAAQQLAPEARAAGEKSLGTDLGGVKVHQGEHAAAAAATMGAKAFTHGQDIVLGESVANSLNPVMAHEIAHTVQQKGATKGIAQKSDRVAQGSPMEVDADQAAAAIVEGQPAEVTQQGAEQIACFEGGEHMELGTKGFARAGIRGPLTVGEVSAEPGMFTALQGDFYGGKWADLEADCKEKPAGVYKLLEVLGREQSLRAAHHHDPEHNDEPNSDGAIVLASMGLRAKYLDYAANNASHFSEKSKASEKQFRSLRADNPEYAGEIAFAQANFGANVAEYTRLHIDALRRAFSDATSGQGPDVALAMDAGATHFLSDVFASGHMRTPRAAMQAEYPPIFRAKGRALVDRLVNQYIPETVDVPMALGLASPAWLPYLATRPRIKLTGVKLRIKVALRLTMDGIASKLADQAANFGAKHLHDMDNKDGLKVRNLAGMKWDATGDHELSEGTENIEIAEQVVAASASHTKKIYELSLTKKGAKKGAKPPPLPFSSMKPIFKLLPIVSAGNKPQQNWHWASASPAYKMSVLKTLVKSSAGLVGSMAEDWNNTVWEATASALQQVISMPDKVSQWLARYSDAMVQWIVGKLPPFTPQQLMNAFM